ncbi:MAG: thiamine pyrophosphate-dependent dehydrogenase E1 component subunit alpha [Rhodospirillaceae bacterium]|jgi:pyruvate dehydrogenase E1 component alpha subunit|nr:thiamine pyrophosphate-dependent dehydrogenase E1 component subunit alpha [Rhodospirillaceae bacterium]MBT5455380.1 thiamine pyrophosphate-dependent dehydrogenase E1 component subunit alpha [Rhodospirillaceae bacterium]
MSDSNRSLDIFEKMIAIRRFEEEVFNLHEAGEFGGHYHLYIGQEATGAAVMASLGAEDRIFTTHRNHGHMIARGADAGAAMAEILGKSTGLNGGRGGTFHLSDPSLGMPHTSALVGGAVPLAAGGAFAAKLKKTGGVGVSMFGDGCFEEGVVYETLNLARLWHLPAIFVCENNTPGAVLKSEGGNNTSNLPEGRVISTPLALGIESHEVDGGDALLVDELFSKCVARVRETSEPIFIEALTERWPGNHYSFPSMVTGITDVAMIWDDSLIGGDQAEWHKTHDPLLRFGRVMLAKGAATRDQITDIDNEATDRMAKAKDFALSSPLPDVDTIPDYVLARAGGN